MHLGKFETGQPVATTGSVMPTMHSVLCSIVCSAQEEACALCACMQHPQTHMYTRLSMRKGPHVHAPICVPQDDYSAKFGPVPLSGYAAQKGSTLPASQPANAGHNLPCAWARLQPTRLRKRGGIDYQQRHTSAGLGWAGLGWAGLGLPGGSAV